MNSRYTQEERLIALTQSPLGKDVLLLAGFSGQEAVSRLFSYELELLSPKTDIQPDALVGEKVTFTLRYRESKTRYFNGYVNRFWASGLTINGMRLYRAEVVPWLWFLTRTSNCRIFQGKTIPKIIEQVFKDLGFQDFDTKGVKGKYSPWDYCVQYRETAFNFVSRLMEQVGIFYWFEHTDKNTHIMMLADHKGAYPDLPEKEVQYTPGSEGPLSAGHVYSWEHEYAFLPGKWTQTDYDFTRPTASLQTSTDTVVKLPNVGKYEIYDYPGEYQQRDEGQSLTKLRMEEEETTCDTIEAASGCRSFFPGGKFTLKRHECATESNKAYLVTAVSHSASEGSYFSGEEGNAEYSNTFSCIPAEVVYRPARITPKPVVQGPQTAVVVGPAGDEIYTDEDGLGRVKVQFHWDRMGENNEKSSCWIRVSQPWAGPNWGAVAIPRIGQEVIVEFLEGDPDRPIITGRVYNGDNMPPYGLPAAAVISGLRSNSTPGGGGYNEYVFDDTKGNELIREHGQYDKDSTIENDLREHVLHDRSRDVTNDETILIGNDRAEEVKRNQLLHVGRDKSEVIGQNKTIDVRGSHTENIGGSMSVVVASTLTETVAINYAETVGGAMELTVGGALAVTVGAAMAEQIGGVKSEAIGGAKSETIGSSKSLSIGGNFNETVKKNKNIKIEGDVKEDIKGQREESVKKECILRAKKIQFVADDQLTLKTGSAEISMKKNGDIQISGKKINVKGSGDVILKGSKIKAN